MDLRAATTLGHVLDCLRDTADRPDGVRILTRTLAQLLPCDHIALWTRGIRRGTYTLRATHPARERDPAGMRQELTLEDLPAPEELASGRCVSLRLRSGPPGVAGTTLEDELGMVKLESLLLAPLSRAGRIEGIAAFGLVDATFTTEQIGLCEQIAPHLGWPLKTWRLQDAFDKGRERRHHFVTLAADVLLAGDAEATAVRLCELTRALFDTTRSAFFMLEERDLVPLAAAGPYGERVGGGSLHVPPGVEPIFDEALATGRVLVVNDFRASRYAATPIPLPFRPQAAMVVPLVDASGTLGLLTASELDEPRRFDADAVEEGRLLGAVATVAIRRVLLLDDLRRASRAKDEFLAAVSHELRTPLNVVLGDLQLLNDRAFGPLTQGQADTIGRVEKGARSQLALVNDLLDLAEIERSNLHCDLGPVRVTDLLGELTDVVDALVVGRPIVFSADVPDEIVVLSDRERLQQVLVNVLANAAKFTERGEIKLRAYVADDRVTIEVADTGPGMEPGFIGRATEPFVRGDRQGTGSGLGLAIVARVLRALGGSLAIDSRPTAGTTIRISLPPAAAPAVERSAAS